MSDDKYLRFIYVMPEKETSIDNLLSEIESLPSVDTSNNSIDTVEEDGPLMLFANKSKPDKKSKKEKKKKKKNKDNPADLLFSDTEKEDVEEDEDFNTISDLAYYVEERDNKTDKELMSEGKKGYKKYKKDSNEFKQEFAEELTLLYALLDDTSKFGKSLEKKWKALDEQKSRGISKYTTDIAQATISAKQTQLSVLREITNVKKTVADLKIKSEKELAKGKQDATEGSAEAIANHYISKIMTHGRGAYIDRLTAPIEFNNENFDMDMYRAGASDTLDDRLEDILEERINAMGAVRSAEADKFIEYENMGVKIYVNKDMETNNWDFIAIDRHGQRVDDYPLPSKRSAGRMRFSDDGSYCTDSRGRQYNVREYWSEHQDDYDDEEDDGYDNYRAELEDDSHSGGYESY